jgi:hypothetical protein
MVFGVKLLCSASNGEGEGEAFSDELSDVQPETAKAASRHVSAPSGGAGLT